MTSIEGGRMEHRNKIAKLERKRRAITYPASPRTITLRIYFFL